MINNVPNKNYVSSGAAKNVAVKNFDGNMKGVDTEVINDEIKKNGLVGTLNSLELDEPTALAGLGIWGGFAGLETFMNKKCQGAWDETFLGKIGSFGDKVSKFLTDKTQSLPKIDLRRKLKEKIPFLATPARPVSSMAKSQLGGITSMTLTDTKLILEKWLIENEKNTDSFKQVFSKAANKDEALKWLSGIADNPKKYQKELDDLINTLSKNGSNKYVSKSVEMPFVGALPNPKPLARKTTFSELANKMRAVTGKGAKTKLGQKLTKGYATMFESVTNGFAGGKIMIGLQALIIAQGLKKAKDAPKGDKLSTFMQETLGTLTYLAAMPLMLKPQYTLGGMKYIGMGNNLENQVANFEAYRNIIEEFNKQTFPSKEAYREARKIAKGKMKKLLNCHVKWWQKPFKFIGRIWASGLDKLAPYQAQGGGFRNNVANALRKFGNKMKGFGGGTLRFVVAMFVIAPLISKIVVKISHAIFGKPQSAKIKEEEEKQKKLEKKQARENRIKAQTIILSVGEEEFNKKLKEHPEVEKALKEDKEFGDKVRQNPMILLEKIGLAEPEIKQGEISSAPADIMEQFVIKK